MSGVDRLWALKGKERWREPWLDLLDISSGEKTLLCISCQIVIFHIMYWEAHRHIIKGLFHPKIKLVIIYSSSCYSTFLWVSFFCRTQIYFTFIVWIKTHSTKYFCSTEDRNSYRFGTTSGWVNNDKSKIFVWTIPLRHFSQTRVLWRCYIAELKEKFTYKIKMSW